MYIKIAKGWALSVFLFIPKALAGGTGSLDYRIDGSFLGQRDMNAGQIEAVAIKLNELAVDCMQSGKSIMAQCHEANLSAFWRLPNTLGSGFDNLRISLLAGENASGFPDGNTPVYMNNLALGYRPSDPFVSCSLSNSLL